MPQRDNPRADTHLGVRAPFDGVDREHALVVVGVEDVVHKPAGRRAEGGDCSVLAELVVG